MIVPDKGSTDDLEDKVRKVNEESESGGGRRG